jgi:hypothetical protein
MQVAATMGKVWTAHAGANNQMRLNLAKRSGLVMRLQQIYIYNRLLFVVENVKVGKRKITPAASFFRQDQ